MWHYEQIEQLVGLVESETGLSCVHNVQGRINRVIVGFVPVAIDGHIDKKENYRTHETYSRLPHTINIWFCFCSLITFSVAEADGRTGKK